MSLRISCCTLMFYARNRCKFGNFTLMKRTAASRRPKGNGIITFGVVVFVVVSLVKAP